MKALDKIKYVFWVVISLMLITACENDGDKIYLSSIEGSDLVATESEVVLVQEKAKQIVLSLAWTKETLKISNPAMSAPNVWTTYIQVSTKEDFSSNMSEAIEKNLSRAYTGAELNTIAKNIGMEHDIPTTVYMRLRSATGNNMESVYSNTISLQLTSYFIDMSKAMLLTAEKEETGIYLSSPGLNGIYTGFIGAASWQNFFLLEGDGTIWGNEPQDGTAFSLSSQDDSWNCWFPEPQGCYYTIMNTPKKSWSALYLPSLTISGDIEGEMSYDRPNNRWVYVFNAASSGSRTVKLSTTGQQYDFSTSDNTSIATPVAFAQTGEYLSLADQAGNITVNIPATGECTLVVDLSNLDAWTCEVVPGSLEPVEVNPYVYLPGVDDGRTGAGWNFDNFLRLYNEDNLTYAGVIDFNSLWGYTINPEKDNWGDKYTYVSGDALVGTFEFKGGENNIPPPTPGLYLADVSLKEFTYKLTEVGNVIYISGLNDVWNFSVTLAATPIAGVYSGPITINFASTNGFSIYLVYNNWNIKFGGSDGKLYYSSNNNIKDDASLTPGTYTLTVDLINQTYNITQ
ncbi:MAG: DUF5114 domain-containing protein [Prevotella sp.]|jgi:hypothetical protein|nr:DUF5114 domain-containing protein [Prevotella sp.]